MLETRAHNNHNIPRISLVRLGLRMTNLIEQEMSPDYKGFSKFPTST